MVHPPLCTSRWPATFPPTRQRNKIKKAQDEYRERNEKDKVAFAAEYGITAKSRELGG